MSYRDIKPCPFCGSEPWGIFGSPGEYWVECHGAGGDAMTCGNWHGTDTYETKDAIAEAWNLRATPAAAAKPGEDSTPLTDKHLKDSEDWVVRETHGSGMHVAAVRAIERHYRATPAAAAKCQKCEGRGWIEDGDPEIGSAAIDCEACATPAAAAEVSLIAEPTKHQSRWSINEVSDAERWNMLPAFFEEYQIDAMKLYRDIGAAILALRTADRASLETHPGTEEA